MHSIGIALIVGMASAALWFGAAGGQSPQVQRTDPDAGGLIFRQNCTSCHGDSGRGDGAAAAQLDPRPANLTSEKTQAKRDVELLETIKFGRPGTSMPGWMSELDERDLRNVMAYIRTLAAPSSY